MMKLQRFVAAFVALAAITAVSADTVSKGKNVTLSLPNVSLQRGDQLTVRVQSIGRGLVTVLLVSRAEGQTTPATHLVSEFPAGGETTVKFDTYRVAVGPYRLDAVLKDEQSKQIGVAAIQIHIGPRRRPVVRVGVFGGPDDKDLDQTLTRWEQLGIDHYFFHHNNNLFADQMARRLDTAYRHGMLAIPIINTYLAPLYDDKLENRLPEDQQEREKWAQVLQPSGEVAMSAWDYPYASPLSPLAQEKMRALVRKVVEQGKGHPGFQWLFLDDEYGLQLNWKGLGIASFDKASVDRFRRETGLELPQPTYRPPGYVAPDDDPYLRWVSVIGRAGRYYGPALEEHNRDLKRVANQLIPNLQVAQMPGAYRGELDAVLHEVYLYRKRNFELKALGDYDYLEALQRGRNKPVWSLIGWYKPGPYPEYTPRQMGLLARIALAKGARAIDFAPHGLLDDAALRATFAQIAETVHRFGPLTSRLHRERMPVAVLRSDTTEAYQALLPWEAAKKRWQDTHRWYEEPWEHTHSFNIGYPALLMAHVPVEIITEADVAAGRLRDYQALVLINHEYSTASLEAKIQEFVNNKGLVFADRSSVVRPQGATPIEYDFSVWSQMIPLGLRNTDPEAARIVHDRQAGLVREAALYVRRAMAGKLKRPVEVDNEYVVYSLSSNGATRYLFLFNGDLWGEQACRVSLAQTDDVVYDLTTGKQVTTTSGGRSTTCSVTIGPGDWKVLMLTPLEVNLIRIRARQERRLLRVNLSVAGEAGLRIPGAHGVKVTVTDANGTVTPDSGYYATDRGRLALDIHLPRAAPVGPWTIAATEMASGKQATATVVVK